MEERHDALEFPITIRLSEPVKFGDKTLTELTINRPLKGKDLKGIRTGKDGEMGVDSLMAVAASWCELPPSVIDKMNARDVMRLVNQVGEFIG